MVEASGFITAGGRSSRMGRDKAWIELDGRTMIERVIDALKPVVTSLNIIAHSDDYLQFGLPVFADTRKGVGPLEAIRTALANSPTPWVILCGCDMPFVTRELFGLLLTIAQQETAGVKYRASETGEQAPDRKMAIVPLNENGLPEPLCALYSTAALPAVTALIDRGNRKASDLFNHIPTRLVAFDEVKNLPGSRLFFDNINTPEDYQRAQKSLIFTDINRFDEKKGP